jgi:hypothetical protein
MVFAIFCVARPVATFCKGLFAFVVPPKLEVESEFVNGCKLVSAIFKSIRA